MTEWTLMKNSLSIAAKPCSHGTATESSCSFPVPIIWRLSGEWQVRLYAWWVLPWRKTRSDNDCPRDNPLGEPSLRRSLPQRPYAAADTQARGAATFVPCLGGQRPPPPRR